MAEAKKLRVGMIGAGEVAQVIHIPTLQLLDHLYSIIAICDICKKSADHCASKFRIPAAIDPEEILNNSEIDAVFVAENE
jgi:predicted dehydrogenase